MKGLVLVAALALVVALLAACGSDSKGGKTPTSDETPEATDTPDNGGGDGGDGGGGEEVLSDLEALVGDFEAITGSVTYSITSEDASGSTTESEWTILQRPPDYRYEFSDPSSPDSGKTIIISSGGDTFICSDTPVGEGICLKSADSQADAATAPLAALFGAPQAVVNAAASASGVDVEHRSIAGLNANCYTVNENLAGEGNKYEACFSDDGLFLFSQTVSSGQTYTIEATAASTNVSDADFEPPYAVTDIPGQ